MKENKSELLLIKKENILDLINAEDNTNNDFPDIIYSKLYQKSLLEKILDIVKNIQLELLSQNSFNKMNKKFSYKLIKHLLKDLKLELNSTFKNNIHKNSEIKHRSNKIINTLFKNNTTINGNKNIPINKKLNLALSKLKFQNFKLENEISSVNTKIKLLSHNKSKVQNTSHFYYQFLTGKKEDIQAYNLLHDKLLDVRDKFKIVVKKKEYQNNIINQLNTAVSLWKEEKRLKNKKYKSEYVITSQIINEETKEYPTKTSSFANDIDCEKEKNNSNEIENDVLYKNKLICI
jgi:hypothetical protein